MKKGCLIVLIVLAVLLVVALVAGAIALRAADKSMGWRLAPKVSHEVLATPDTRIRLVIRPELLTSYLVDFIPKDVDIPTGGFEMQQILNQVVPREIALLARSDMIARRMRVTLFINEKRGGPLIHSVINDEDPFSQVEQVVWTSEGLEFRGRGELAAEGYLAIPGEIEAELLEIWPTRSPQPPATIQGNHHAELVIDNLNGDLLALVATVATAAGESWEKIRAEDMADQAINIIETIHVARLSANLVNKDTAEFDLHITADPKTGPGLHFLLAGLAMPWLKDQLKEQQNLVMTGDIRWDETQSAVVGKYSVSGLEALIKQHVNL